jgi:glycosyltransferase involved in cell wall biosynthesis
MAAGEKAGAGNRTGYAIITPARNEAAFIEGTITSVINQIARPAKWIIVSDGSTDGTDDIVGRYAAQHDWIELIRMPERRDRHFAAKVSAFNAGVDRLRDVEYGVIAALDADISFDADYFAFLLDKLAANPKLGLVGTPFAENGVTYDYRFASVEHVSGACQVFRRECFEAIGGYVPMKGGGIDLMAVLSARMKGWEVRTFPERICHHHRKQGSATKNGLAVILNDGRKDYLLGADPIWQICRAINRLRSRPYVIGGLTLLGGYTWAAMLRTPKTAPKEIVAFRRHDQRTRLRGLVRRFAGAGGTGGK